MANYLDTNDTMNEQDSLDAISTAPGGPPAANDPGSVAPAPDADPATKAAVEQWVKRIQGAKKHYDKRFKRMKSCQMIANEGRDKDWSDENYTVPVLKRHINVAVAALYARNPTPSAKRKKKVQFTLWDGNFASLQQAMQAAQPPRDPQTGAPLVDPQTGMPAQGDPNAQALLMEVQTVHQNNVMMDRLGKTMEILAEHYMDDQDAGFKQQLKAAVRRTKVCSVAWVKLGFQRTMDDNPDVLAQMTDVTSQLRHLAVLTQDYAEGVFDENTSKMDELRSLMATLESQQQMIVREGPVFAFPRANRVIVDTKCTHLKTLLGAEWVAEEFPPMSREEVKELFRVDIGTNFKSYQSDKKTAEDQEQNLAVVYEVWNKKTQQNFVICEGYCDYIRPPAAPDVKLTRFWPFFPLVFNEVEDDDEIYPNSDVWDARHMQREYNTVRQGLREHRMQNKPRYATIKGKLEETDLKNLATSPSGSVIELNALEAGAKVEDVLQAIKTVPIDPNLYEVSSVFSDVERVIGSSQADLGAPSGTTATQSSIIEQGRSTMNSDNVDDLDDMLSQLIRATGEVMLQELDIDTVKKIAGPGAVWPTTPVTRQQIADDLWLEIKAGSSGRPNRAAELANMERGLPYLIQIPGVNPYPLGKRYGELLDLPVDDIVIEGMPSIVAQNSAASRDPFAGGAAGASTHPQAQAGADQGANGAMNAANPATNEPGGQPAYPAGGTGMEARGVIGTRDAPVPAPRYQAQKIQIGPGAASA